MGAGLFARGLPPTLLAPGRFPAFSRFVDALFEKRLPLPPEDKQEWAAEADWARLEQEPLRARALLRWGSLVLAALLVWAAFAEIDEVTRGEGKVIPSSQLQIIQSMDGGIVSDILVR